MLSWACIRHIGSSFLIRVLVVCFTCGILQASSHSSCVNTEISCSVEPGRAPCVVVVPLVAVRCHVADVALRFSCGCISGCGSDPVLTILWPCCVPASRRRDAAGAPQASPRADRRPDTERRQQLAHSVQLLQQKAARQQEQVRYAAPPAGGRLWPFSMYIRVSPKKTFLLNFGAAEGRPCFTSVGCYADEISSESGHI